MVLVFNGRGSIGPLPLSGRSAGLGRDAQFVLLAYLPVTKAYRGKYMEKTEKGFSI